MICTTILCDFLECVQQPEGPAVSAAVIFACKVHIVFQSNAFKKSKLGWLQITQHTLIINILHAY